MTKTNIPHITREDIVDVEGYLKRQEERYRLEFLERQRASSSAPRLWDVAAKGEQFGAFEVPAMSALVGHGFVVFSTDRGFVAARRAGAAAQTMRFPKSAAHTPRENVDRAVDHFRAQLQRL